MTETERKKRNEKIREVFREVGTLKGTARKLKLDRRTVSRVLQGKDGPRPAVASLAPRPSKLDPYRPLIQRLVQEDGLTAVLVQEEIAKLGYDGRYSILKDYVRTLRPTAARRATTRLEHPPGAEGQVDWSSYTVSLGGETLVVQAFSMVLPFSRYMVVRMALDTRLETLLALHEEALEELGGYPAVMTYDFVPWNIIIGLPPGDGLRCQSLCAGGVSLGRHAAPAGGDSGGGSDGGESLGAPASAAPAFRAAPAATRWGCSSRWVQSDLPPPQPSLIPPQSDPRTHAPLYRIGGQKTSNRAHHP